MDCDIACSPNRIQCKIEYCQLYTRSPQISSDMLLPPLGDFSKRIPDVRFMTYELALSLCFSADNRNPKTFKPEIEMGVSVLGKGCIPDIATL